MTKRKASLNPSRKPLSVMMRTNYIILEIPEIFIVKLILPFMVAECPLVMTVVMVVTVLMTMIMGQGFPLLPVVALLHAPHLLLAEGEDMMIIPKIEIIAPIANVTSPTRMTGMMMNGFK